ncbi:MAG: CaiB/BaiF CoA transferase family protein [Hyphomonadaceae bacterium]
MTSENRPKGPCAGIKVLEVATMVAGPMAGQMLGDLGADVVKIEPPGGDPLRLVKPIHKGVGALFMAMNRHKRSLVLDLKNPEAQAIARRLALQADVLLENSRPGVLDRLGLGYESLRKENPGLIYASVSGFGLDGPYAKRPAFDQVLQGLTGIMRLQGGEGAPQAIRNSVVDKYTASAAASAITAALLYRERNGGEGQRVSVSLLDAFSSYAMMDCILNDVYAECEDRPARINAYVPIKAADGYMIGWIQTDDQFARMCKLIGREDLLNDPRFKGAERLYNSEAMWREIEKSISHMKIADVFAKAEEEGVAIGPVNTIADFMADPQVRHNRGIVEHEDAEFGTIRHLNYPARFEKSPASVEARAPKLGEHTEGILKELGFANSEIAAARAAKAVG